MRNNLLVYLASLTVVLSFSVRQEDTSANVNPIMMSLYSNGHGVTDPIKQKDNFGNTGPLVFPQENLADHVYVSITQETIYRFKAFLEMECNVKIYDLSNLTKEDFLKWDEYEVLKSIKTLLLYNDNTGKEIENKTAQEKKFEKDITFNTFVPNCEALESEPIDDEHLSRSSDLYWLKTKTSEVESIDFEDKIIGVVFDVQQSDIWAGVLTNDLP
uniref:Peptidase S1 domain-containing protein n=1 Tax=Strongyloides venezuelensis TaxID=75913 RepID=A0A0K0G0I0_STRVS